MAPTPFEIKVKQDIKKKESFVSVQRPSFQHKSSQIRTRKDSQGLTASMMSYSVLQALRLR